VTAAGTPLLIDRAPAMAPERVHALNRRAAIAAVSVAALLIAGKAVAAVVTGSLSLLSSLIDSMLDLLASALNLWAIRQAAQPADHEHRFGHGKAEPLAGLAQAAFVGGSAAFLLLQAADRLIDPQPVVEGRLGIAVMLLSIVLTAGLVLYQKWVIRRTASVAVGADSLHYASDLLVNVSVVVAIVLTTELGWLRADAAFAMAIGAYILRSAWTILVNSLDLLMDHELPESDRQKIADIVRAHPAVLNMHDLRTRSSGTQCFIQLHLELDGHLSLLEAHAIADEVMQQIEAAFPQAEVLIHEDPFGVAEKRASFD
jgi:ferrous-iron efflux pump FieF